MIYGNLKNQRYLVKDYEEISNCFTKKNIEGYGKAIGSLSKKMKSLGATRPYYVCQKIYELYERYIMVNKTESINIDIDQFNEIWSLYSTLIETTIQYFLFLDFEFDILVMNYKVLPEGMVDLNDAARYKSRFGKIAQNLTINPYFRLLI